MRFVSHYDCHYAKSDDSGGSHNRSLQFAFRASFLSEILGRDSRIVMKMCEVNESALTENAFAESACSSARDPSGITRKMEVSSPAVR